MKHTDFTKLVLPCCCCDDDDNLLALFVCYRKPALFDGLEVDQYVWAILQHLSTNPHAVEVTIDHTASWRPLDPGQFMSLMTPVSLCHSLTTRPAGGLLTPVSLCHDPGQFVSQFDHTVSWWPLDPGQFNSNCDASSPCLNRFNERDCHVQVLCSHIHLFSSAPLPPLGNI